MRKLVLEYLEFTQLSNFPPLAQSIITVLEYLEFTQLSNTTCQCGADCGVLEYLEFTQLSNPPGSGRPCHAF